MSAQPAAKPAGDYEIKVVGAPRASIKDVYYGLLSFSWPRTILLIIGTYLGINLVFAVLYLLVGGVSNARPGSLADAFFFSIQTMGTIGYGAMVPSTPGANALVVAESTIGLLLTATVGGLVFAKFSRPSARMMFSHEATISPMNGVPTLSFRLGNLRGNRIAEALVRVVFVRSEKTAEGVSIYRMLDLPLVRDRILSLSRSWAILHTIDEKSPFFGQTPDSIAAADVELQISVSGTDDLWMQTVHATHRYLWSQIVWGHRHADVLTEHGDLIILDLTKFHVTEPTQPTPAFPYPK